MYGVYYSKGTPAAAGGANYKNDAVALIPRLSGKNSTVKNIGVDYAYIKASNCGAALVGNVSGTDVRNIENCYAGENVTVSAHVAGGIAGGGDANLHITSCYSLATLKATHQKAGITGGFWSWGGSNQVIKNCYSTTAIHGNSSGSQTDCYGNISTNCKGQAAIANFPLNEPYCATDSYPTLRVFKNLDSKNWNGLGIREFVGAGTAQDPYLVENAGQLAYVVYSGASGHYKMTNDIYINDVSSDNWNDNTNLSSWIYETDYNNGAAYEASKKAFKGTFDGNGYSVYGIWYPKDIKTPVAGLFLSANGAVIKNVGVKSSYIYGGYTKQWAIDNGYATSSDAGDRAFGTVAAILGYAIKGSPTTVSGCFADESVHCTNYSNGNLCATAGIVGYIMNSASSVLTVSDCFSAAVLTSNNANKQNGILGSCWNGYYIAKNNYSVGYTPFMTGNNVVSKVSNAYVSNYSNKGTTGSYYTVLTDAQLRGENALKNLNGFSNDVWYSVKNDAYTPLHRVYGTAIGDVDENGAGKGSGDIIALRTTLIGSGGYKNTDYNRDGKTDICDLVEMNIEFRPIITFNANGGTFAGGKTVLNLEQTIGSELSVAFPTRDDYGFIGWSLTEDGDTVNYTTVTADMDGVTLYAQWGNVLRIAPAFGDNMVLQRNKPICVYGTGKGTGTVILGSQTKEVTSTSDEWEVYFDPIEASTEPITFKTLFGGYEIEYKNVLVGDVYITSGQSNMELTLSGTEQSNTVKANSNLRFKNRASNAWNEFTASNVESVSAISILFANKLANELNNEIPIGIISASVGASRIDDWTHRDYCYCEEYDFAHYAHSDYTYYDQGHHDLYDRHILPIEKMTTAGVLWYQGESNRGVGEAYRYLDMFKTLVNCWRTRMGDADLPFYTVQIMLYTNDAGCDGYGKPVDEYNIRIAQGEAARTMKNVTVCTMLSYEDTVLPSGALDIHPTDKLPVATALANAVLTTYYKPNGDYAKSPEYSGPLYDTVTIDGSTATISFTHTAEGLMLTSGDTVTELEVCDSDGKWVAATGTLNDNKVTVTVNGVSEIRGIRMGYRNRPAINLYNTVNGAYGYCASPFVWTAE